MAEYFTLNDDGMPEQHTGEVADTPRDYKKMMLDYGWVPPVAYGAYKLAEPLIEKGRDYLKSRKLGKQKKSGLSFGDEGIIDVPSREITEKESVNTKTPATKQNPLDAYAQQKHGYPLSELEAFSKGPLKNQTDIDLVASQFKRNVSPLASPISGTVSNQPAGVPNAVSPMSQLTGQLPTPQMISQNPAVSQPPVAPSIGQFNPSSIGQPLQDPLAGQGYQTPVQEIGPRPNLVAAAQSGQDMSQAIKEDVAHMLQETDKPVAPPQGMKEQYKKSKSQPIGPGGYNWFASQVGHEAAPARWAEQYGEKNVPHAQVQREFSETRYPPKPNPTGEKTGGAFGSPKYIPEYIKGNASLGGMAATMGAAAIPALAAAGYHAYQGNKEKVNAELKDAWNSMKSVVTMPIDVAKAAGKGDFGPFKDLLMSMNPGTLLMNEANKRDEAVIQRMIQAEKSSSNRGIAPPNR